MFKVYKYLSTQTILSLKISLKYKRLKAIIGISINKKEKTSVRSESTLGYHNI